jgi:hypothetical protein
MQPYFPPQPPVQPAPRPSYPPPQQQAAVRPQQRSAPVARGQSPEEPKVKPLPPMPTPEQLGVSLPKPTDWSELRVRLDRLGASHFQLTKQGDGWRFTCQLPSGRTLEGAGSTDADAVLAAIQKQQ